jgi:acetoin utilization deacetylase AcuC-like enzyme
MLFFFNDAQLDHRPTQYMVHGKIVAPFENPNRAETLIAALEKLGLERARPADAGLDPILAVHADHYVSFLGEAFDLFQQLPNAGPEVLPNVHPYVAAGADYAPRNKPRVTGIIGRAGWYFGDLSCATTEGTYRAAYASAQSAISATRTVLDDANASFALCRPPGHHAYIDRASGFCYFNNAAIAAEILRERHGRVAILDFDTHHGDGTQAIFYRRDDVFFGSTHTDPSAYYPHFAGYADERGAGDGEGFNLNLPLVPGSGDVEFLAGVERLAEAAAHVGARALVVSAGWDAHHDDPLSKLKVTGEAFGRVGEILASLRLPTVIVQEGGYSLAAVAEAAPNFIEGFRGREAPLSSPLAGEDVTRSVTDEG